MSEPVYLVLNGPHRGKRYPASAGETLALPDYESLESFPATTTVLYTLRVLVVDDPDGTRKANRFWLTADTPTSGIQMLDLLIDLVGDGSVPPHKWSYCPYCGVEAPRPGLHKQGCPAHDKGGPQ